MEPIATVRAEQRGSGQQLESVMRSARLLRTAGATLFSAGLVLAASGLATNVGAGFSAGPKPCGTGNGNYWHLTADCPTGYLPATTAVASAYAPGQQFTFTVTVHNPNGWSISVPTTWGYSHILSVKDSSTGAPTNVIDVSDGYTPAGNVPLTDHNFFAYGMFRGSVQSSPLVHNTFVLSIPAGHSTTVTRTGSAVGCGYYQLDLAGGGEVLASGVIRVLGCDSPPPTPTATAAPSATPRPTPTRAPTPAPTPTPATTTPTPTPTSTPTLPATSTPTPSPSSGAQGVDPSAPTGGVAALTTAPDTGAELDLTGGAALMVIGLGFMVWGRRARRNVDSEDC